MPREVQERSGCAQIIPRSSNIAQDRGIMTSRGCETTSSRIVIIDRGTVSLALAQVPATDQAAANRAHLGTIVSRCLVRETTPILISLGWRQTGWQAKATGMTQVHSVFGTTGVERF